jgi:diacylglycerol kinase (ATP)
MLAMKLLVIGNPIAGGGKAGAKMAQLEGVLRQRGHDIEVRRTTARLDAMRWAGELPDDLDRLIVAGGDGTLNEVLNGLDDVGRVPLIQMPAGTANVLVRELRLPWKPTGVADLVESGKVRQLDMGVMSRLDAQHSEQEDESQLTSQRFLVLLSSGFDAMVIEDIHQNRTGKLGARGYVMPVLRTLRKREHARLRVTIDEGDQNMQQYDAAMVVVANSQNYAGYFRLADKASMDSGVFDVVMVPKITIGSLARYAWAAKRGKISSMKDVIYVHAKRLRIESEDVHGSVAIEADGEYAGRTPIEVEIKAGAVPMVVPAD